jgi:hypothetical protein
MDRLTLLLTLALLAGCGAGWRQRPGLGLGALPPRQQVQVWSAGRMDRWHAVVIAADSVSGIPFLQAVDCDSCRRHVPRAQVDSLRLGNPTAGFWKTVGLVIGVPLFVFSVICAVEGGGPPCTAGS